MRPAVLGVVLLVVLLPCRAEAQDAADRVAAAALDGAERARAEARYPALLDTRSVQASLRPEEIAVAFFLAEPNSFRWVLSKEHVIVDRVAGRGAIEKTSTRLLDLLRTPSNGAEASRVAAELGRMLFGGISTADDRPMVVVPHGALNYVPFEVLPLQGKMLVERHAVSYAPSLNALVQLRRTPSNTAPFRVRALVSMAQYPVLHFATHGLVVLSEYPTASGPEITGDGMIGLSRAFFNAGARSVVAPLWNLNDRFAAEFVERFYSEINQGHSSEEALRRAKVAYVNHPRYSHPFYWSSLVMLGDGTPALVTKPIRPPMAPRLLAAVMALAAVAVAAAKLRKPA